MSSTVLQRQHIASSLYSDLYARTFAHELHEPTALWIKNKNWWTKDSHFHVVHISICDLDQKGIKRSRFSLRVDQDKLATICSQILKRRGCFNPVNPAIISNFFRMRTIKWSRTTLQIKSLDPCRKMLLQVTRKWPPLGKTCMARFTKFMSTTPRQLVLEQISSCLGSVSDHPCLRLDYTQPCTYSKCLGRFLR